MKIKIFSNDILHLSPRIYCAKDFLRAENRKIFVNEFHINAGGKQRDAFFPLFFRSTVIKK